MLASLVFFFSLTLVQAQECSICPDGSEVGTPGRIIPFLRLDENKTDPTCEEFDAFSRTITSDSFSCGLARAQAGYCGCLDVTPVDACSLCADSEITKPEKLAPDGDACSDIAEYVRFLSPEDCGNTRGETILLHSALCGCPGVEPQCSLCPDGAEVPNPDMEVFDGKCGEIFDLFQTFTADACDSSDRLIAVNGVRCGCRDGSEFPECSIRQNADMCTKELLDTVDETCECYSFCNDQFLGCEDFPGKFLQAAEVCPDGLVISGCNYAGVTEPTDDSASDRRVKSGISLVLLSALNFVAFGL